MYIVQLYNLYLIKFIKYIFLYFYFLPHTDAFKRLITIAIVIEIDNGYSSMKNTSEIKTIINIFFNLILVYPRITQQPQSCIKYTSQETWAEQVQLNERLWLLKKYIPYFNRPFV